MYWPACGIQLGVRDKLPQLRLATPRSHWNDAAIKMVLPIGRSGLKLLLDMRSSFSMVVFIAAPVAVIVSGYHSLQS